MKYYLDLSSFSFDEDNFLATLKIVDFNNDIVFNGITTVPEGNLGTTDNHFFEPEQLSENSIKLNDKQEKLICEAFRQIFVNYEKESNSPNYDPENDKPHVFYFMPSINCLKQRGQKVIELDID